MDSMNVNIPVMTMPTNLSLHNIIMLLFDHHVVKNCYFAIFTSNFYVKYLSSKFHQSFIIWVITQQILIWGHVEPRIDTICWSCFQTNKKATSGWFTTVTILFFLCSLVAEFIHALSRLEITDIKESMLCNVLVDSCQQSNKSYEMWVITVRTSYCLKWKYCAK